MRPGGGRSPWLPVGAGVVVLYLAVTAATLLGTSHHVRPLFDGLLPPPRYHWAHPPKGYISYGTPTRTTATVPLGAGGSLLSGPTTADGQLVLNLPDGALPGRERDTEVGVTIVPHDAARLGATPEGLVPDGNAYEVRLRYLPSGTPVERLDRPGNVVLTTPEPASVLLHATRGHDWQALPTTRVGGVDAVGASFGAPGYYLAAIPGRARPAGSGGGSAETVRRALIVVLATALAAHLGRQWWRRSRDRPRA